MKTKQLIVAIISITFLNQSLNAQDVHFSQYSETPSSINPALIGVKYETRATLNYKNQWSSIGNKYETMAFSFEQTIKHKKLKNNYLAVAVNIFKDVAGDAQLKSLNPNLGISFLQKINKNMMLSSGIQSGFFYKTIDVSSLHWGEQWNGYSYDSNLPSGEKTPRSSVTSFDIGGGLNLNYVQSEGFISSKDAARFDIGFSLFHFGLTNNAFISSSEKLNTKFCTYFNGEFSIPNSRNAIMPSFLYMRQGPNSEFITGALFKFILGDPSTYTANKKPFSISVGGYYRFKDAIVPSVLFQLDKYAVGVSYDINISALTPASNRLGGIELMLKYNILSGYGINLGRSDAQPSY